MWRIIGVIIVIVAFRLVWMGPVIEHFNGTSFPDFSALKGYHVFSYSALVLGGFIALFNFCLHFIRPLIYKLRHGSMDGYKFISGIPLFGTLILLFFTFEIRHEIWVAVVVTILLLADTGGPLWFVICTWRDDSLWGKKKFRFI